MKYALVTGGSRGIGRAVCVKLAQMGYHIIINYVSNATEAQKTLELVRQAGQDGEILMFDVSNRQQTSKAIESWENAHPEEYIEVLVNNMASVSGVKGMPGQTNYSAAKGAIIAATKALAQEVARKNVTVNAVAPGFIRTDMVEGLDEDTLKKTIPANRFGTPEEVAELVGFLVSPNAGYITGNVISINGGLYT